MATRLTHHRARLAIALGLAFTSGPAVQLARAADHGDAPTASANRSTDIADVYAFLDPNAPSELPRLVLIMTVGGFIVPGEAANFGFFDPSLRYRFSLELTGDAEADQTIDVRFSNRPTSATDAQTATITLPFGATFTARTTPPTPTGTQAPTPVVTTDPGTTQTQFYAGHPDDPFFFDIPAFLRFVGPAFDGNPSTSPNRAVLQRGRDTFAGYNVSAIAVSLPLQHLQLANPNDARIGVFGSILRQVVTTDGAEGQLGSGDFVQVERMGNPAVNVALIPFRINSLTGNSFKDDYNRASPAEDKAGRFAPRIRETLQALGTPQAQIDALAGIAITNGDFLRLSTAIPNTGPAGGTNGPARFPNGRRLSDDVIDILLRLIVPPIPTPLETGDSVYTNDVGFLDRFPFLARQQVPLDRGTLDDNTRN
jgi:hypothetical protein